MEELNVTVAGTLPGVLFCRKVEDEDEIVGGRKKRKSKEEMTQWEIDNWWKKCHYDEVDKEIQIYMPSAGIIYALADTARKTGIVPKNARSRRSTASDSFKCGGIRITKHSYFHDSKGKILSKADLKPLRSMCSVPPESGRMVPIIRPLIEAPWFCTISYIIINEEALNEEIVLETMSKCGLINGWGAWRPGNPRGGEYGMFKVAEKKNGEWTL